MDLGIIKSNIILEEYEKAPQIVKSLPSQRRDRYIESLTLRSLKV
ncbi:MAG: hypothetical protein V7L21_04445 [Nostoc sp.]